MLEILLQLLLPGVIIIILGTDNIKYRKKIKVLENIKKGLIEVNKILSDEKAIIINDKNKQICKLNIKINKNKQLIESLEQRIKDYESDPYGRNAVIQSLKTLDERDELSKFADDNNFGLANLIRIKEGGNTTINTIERIKEALRNNTK